MSDLAEQMLAESDWDVPHGGARIKPKDGLAATHCRWCGDKLTPVANEFGHDKQFCRVKHAFYGPFTIWRARQDRIAFEESQACRSSTS